MNTRQPKRISAFAITIALVVLTMPSWSLGDIVHFVPTGAAGDGLLEGNINPPTGEAGTGGIGATGIFFNTDNNLLHVHVEWGSQNGYTDLSEDVQRLHLHGPTSNGYSDAYGQTAPLLITLSNSGSFNPSRTGGSVNDNYLIDNADVDALLSGRTYINVHLSEADTGVIRGYLTPVPEPGSISVLCGLGSWLLLRRRRKQ